MNTTSSLPSPATRRLVGARPEKRGRTTRRRLPLLCALLGGVLAGCSNPSKEAEACSKLKDLKLEHSRIVAADYSSEGHQISLQTAIIGIPWFIVPESCRVKLVIVPTPDSHIETEVWLPATNWNGRLWSAGNGGLAGSIDELSMTLALSHGFATSGTDTGHSASDRDGRWALRHGEKLIDFGYRAIHETAVQAKALIQAFYGRPARFSYFASGSNGGREALAEAQRYPEDYEGIEAGAPAFDGSNNVLVGGWLQGQLFKTETSWIPPAKLPAIAAAAMKSCDAIDGLKDGLIDDPRRCLFQPETLLCKAGDADNCLTAPQVGALEALYRGPGGRDLRDFGYYGYEPGGELNWGDWLLGAAPRKSVLYGYAQEFNRYLVYGDPSWTLARFDFAGDRVEIDRRLSPIYDARDPDLSRFAARGGKLVLFHGWADMALQPRLTIDYYQHVQAQMGADAAGKSAILYMVPGMAHVFAGNGPNAFGQISAPPASASPSNNIGSALVAWVEKGIRPGSIVAGKYDNDFAALLEPEGMTPVRTRPLCPYPQVARWNGHGSSGDAKNFNCVAPPP